MSVDQQQLAYRLRWRASPLLLQAEQRAHGQVSRAVLFGCHAQIADEVGNRLWEQLQGRLYDELYDNIGKETG